MACGASPAAALALLELGASALDVDAGGNSALHHALRLRAPVRGGADPSAALPPPHADPLGDRRQVELVRALLAGGCAPCARNAMGRSPLHMAACEPQGSVALAASVGALLEGLPRDGGTPLRGVWRALLCADGAGATPLHLVASAEGARALLAACPQGVSRALLALADGAGDCALVAASREGRWGVVVPLLAAGARARARGRASGLTALHHLAPACGSGPGGRAPGLGAPVQGALRALLAAGASAGALGPALRDDAWWRAARARPAAYQAMRAALEAAEGPAWAAARGCGCTPLARAAALLPARAMPPVVSAFAAAAGVPRAARGARGARGGAPGDVYGESASGSEGSLLRGGDSASEGSLRADGDDSGSEGSPRGGSASGSDGAGGAESASGGEGSEGSDARGSDSGASAGPRGARAPRLRLRRGCCVNAPGAACGASAGGLARLRAPSSWHGHASGMLGGARLARSGTQLHLAAAQNDGTAVRAWCAQPAACLRELLAEAEACRRAGAGAGAGAGSGCPFGGGAGAGAGGAVPGGGCPFARARAPAGGAAGERVAAGEGAAAGGVGGCPMRGGPEVRAPAAGAGGGSAGAPAACAGGSPTAAAATPDRAGRPLSRRRHSDSDADSTSAGRGAAASAAGSPAVSPGAPDSPAASPGAPTTDSSAVSQAPSTDSPAVSPAPSTDYLPAAPSSRSLPPPAAPPTPPPACPPPPRLRLLPQAEVLRSVCLSLPARGRAGRSPSSALQALCARVSPRAMLSAEDAAGMTPLHLAAWRGHTQALAALLEAGGDPGRRGCGPLQVRVGGRGGWARCVGLCATTKPSRGGLRRACAAGRRRILLRRDRRFCA